MRIVQLIDSATVGGAEENTAMLAEELARRGHELCLVSPPGPYTDRFDGLAGVEAKRLPVRGPLKAAAMALGAFLREWQPDLVHSHMLRADVIVAMQGRKTPYRRATSIHNMFNLEVPSWSRRTMYRILATWSYRRFDAVLPVSAFVRDYLKRYLWVKGERIQVVPNGIDAQGFRARSTESSSLPEHQGRRVLLTVGRLDANKGQELVLEAAASLKRDDVLVWIVGTGPREGALRQLAQQRGVDCELLGRRDDVPALMARCHVYVQASRWEALPNTVLEALALGRPVVSTAAGGTPEAVRDGETGWVVPVNDVSGLARALGEALDHEQEARDRGEAGKVLVDREFTIARSADLLLAHPRLHES